MKRYYINMYNAEIWTNCPYYMSYCQDEATKHPVETTVGYSKALDLGDEGSVAHKIAELSLKESLNISTVNPAELYRLSGYVSKSTYQNILAYVAYVNSLVQDYTEDYYDRKQLYDVESYITNDHIYAHGRPDFYILDKEKRTLEVVDFKTGKGIDFHPANMQLVLYAASLVLKYSKPIDTVRLTVFQNSAKTIDMTVKDLWKKYKKAMNAFENWKSILNSPGEDFPRNPGNHCDSGMCPFRPNCAKYHLSAAQKVVDELSKCVGDIRDLRTDDLSHLMTGLISLQKTKETVSDRIIEHIENGEKVDGYRLLSAKNIKKIADENSLAKKMIELSEDGSIFLEDAFDLKSPVQLEKCLPATVYDDFVKKNIVFEKTKPTLKKC